MAALHFKELFMICSPRGPWVNQFNAPRTKFERNSRTFCNLVTCYWIQQQLTSCNLVYIEHVHGVQDKYYHQYRATHIRFPLCVPYHGIQVMHTHTETTIYFVCCVPPFQCKSDDCNASKIELFRLKIVSFPSCVGVYKNQRLFVSDWACAFVYLSVRRMRSRPRLETNILVIIIR